MATPSVQCINVPVESGARRIDPDQSIPTVRKRNAFAMTETELMAMAAAAIMGESRRPKRG